ncbi:MAG: MFS transporter [Alphaproteobacteria bacterium]
MRPLGALFFGHFGDRVGRKVTFLITITLMGLATFAIGFLPTYDTAGMTAPVLLISLRLLQGFALGGEYGGAAIYVAEHAPSGLRGFLTGWIQTSAGVGFASALGVIIVTRTTIGEAAFADWGWRVPFLLSFGLLVISIFMRMRLKESPAFHRIKEEGALSDAPLIESFFNWRNLRLVLLALFAIMISQGAIWYTVSFYLPSYLERVLKVDGLIVNQLMIVAIAVSTVLYVFFAWLSDLIGRKIVMMAGILGAVLTLFPGVKLITQYANPALVEASVSSPVRVSADPATCTIQFDPIGKTEYTASCDIAKASLAQAGVGYTSIDGPVGAPALVHIGAAEVVGVELTGLSADQRKAGRAEFQSRLRAALDTAGYPAKADPARVDRLGILKVLLWFVVCACALYGPQAAALVELFPTRIRYSALSLPYHIGTGWFGGFMPAIAFAIVTATGNLYSGLWFPVVVGAISLVVGLLLLPETKNRDIHD